MTNSKPRREAFGVTPDGLPITKYVLENRQSAQIHVIGYGAIITSILLPRRSGGQHDVVLGHDHPAGYLDPRSPYLGAVIGRYANRIANGQFALAGRTYTLARNDGPNHLHGGVKGFGKVVWKAEPFTSSDVCGLRLAYTSPDGEEGYPGTLTAVVTYSLTSANELICDYRATTTKPTPVNLTQHSYFNLAGPGIRDILEHELTINADALTPIGPTLIPRGEIVPVAGTPFDFRTEKPIGVCINADDDQIRFAGGYDHNFVLNNRVAASGWRPACMSRIVAACWKCLPISPGFSSTRATFSTARSPEKRASFTNIVMDSVWRRSIFPIRPTKPIFL